MKHITIVNYEKYQAYKDGRRIEWVKLLVDIVDQFDKNGKPKKYYQMSDCAKLNLLHLLCLAPRYANNIPYPADTWLKDQLGVCKLELQPLIDNGYIELDEVTVQDSTEPYKDTDDKDIDKVQLVFDHWNSFAGKGNFKSHRKLTKEIKRAIRERIKDYDLDDIKDAIGNYAKVLVSKEYLWTYAWTIYQFLTRHNPTYRDELQLFRFLPNNFDEYDYLTPEAKRDRAINRNRPQSRPLPAKQAVSPYTTMPIDKLKEEYENGNSFTKRLIESKRPEIKEAVENG